MTATTLKKSTCATIFLLAAIGVGIAGYLTFLHYAYERGQAVASPGCGSGGWLDCQLVALSIYSLFAGRPLAAWGTALYAIWIALALIGLSGEPHHRLASLRLITVTAALAFIVDGYLAWLMLAKIHAVCAWCAATYLVNLGVFLVGWSALRRAGEPLGHVGSDVWLVMPWISSPTPSPRIVQVLTLIWCLTLVGSVWGITEVTTQLTQGNAKETREQLRRYVQQQVPAQLQVAGAPTHGAEQARLTIVEFSDFLCPVCQRSATTMKAVLANHPRDVRMVFKYYPLDSSCNTTLHNTLHPGACRLAAAAACAHAQDKFWPLHDRLFASSSYDVNHIEADAKQAGLDLPRWQACMTDGTGLAAVTRDIEEANRLHVQSTPTFFVNGYLFAGGIPPSAFEILVQEFLQPSPARE